jgi:hypothetical protein
MTSIKSKGFTLIELLISASILMMLLGIGFYGYKLYDDQWRNRIVRSDIVFANYQKFDLFHQALSDIVPYSVGENDTSGFYFLGRFDGFTAVSMSPIFDTESSAVIRVFIENADDGTKRLVYEEASLKNTLLLDARQHLDFKHRTVIVKDIPEMNIKYFAVPDLASPIEFDEFDQPKERRVWLDMHDGLIARTHPEQIIINVNGYPLYAKISVREKAITNRMSEEAF